MPAKKISSAGQVPPKTEPSLVPRGLRASEAAAYAGTTIFFIRDSIWRGELPAMKLGRRLIFAREDLDHFLDRQKTRCAA